MNNVISLFYVNNLAAASNCIVTLPNPKSQDGWIQIQIQIILTSGAAPGMRYAHAHYVTVHVVR